MSVDFVETFFLEMEIESMIQLAESNPACQQLLGHLEIIKQLQISTIDDEYKTHMHQFVEFCKDDFQTKAINIKKLFAIIMGGDLN